MYGDIDEDSSEYLSCRTDTILYTSPSILWCNLLHLKSLFYKNHGVAEVSQPADNPTVDPRYVGVKITICRD